MPTYICEECFHQWDVPYAVNGKRVTKTPACPGCGPGTTVTRIVEGERERDADDGQSYADPRDERDERRSRL